MRDEELLAFVQKDTLNVGDLVVLVEGGGEHGLFGFDTGNTYYVAQTDKVRKDGKTIGLSISRQRGSSGYAHPHQLRKVRD